SFNLVMGEGKKGSALEVPLVSVIMSVYNEPEIWLAESIDSILSQTYKEFEFFIVNDNPENLTLAKVLQLYEDNDSRVRIIKNEVNIGLTKSLNKALSLVKGKYIIRMDADDVSLPQRFEKQVTFMEENPNIIASGAAIERFG